MVDVAKRLFDVGRMDALSRRESPIHRVDARAKLLTTLLFIGVVLSFDKYSVAQLIPFLIYPAALSLIGGIPLGFLTAKLVYVAPFALLVGAFNPLLDTTPMVALGPVTLSGGWVSFAAIMVRFALTVGATLALLAVTGLFPLLHAADRLGTPRVLIVQLMFFYRYLFVLAGETLRMLRARAQRGGKGIGARAFGAMVGQLLLRTLDRAERIHRAMLARGFDGEIRQAAAPSFKLSDALFCLGWGGFFALLRFVNLPELIGGRLLEHIA